MPVGGLVQHPGPLAVELRRPSAEDLEQQGVLGAEVVVDAGEVHAGLGGDVAHRHVLEAMQREQALGRGEDGGLGGGLPFRVGGEVRDGLESVGHRVFQTLV